MHYASISHHAQPPACASTFTPFVDPRCSRPQGRSKRPATASRTLDCQRSLTPRMQLSQMDARGDCPFGADPLYRGSAHPRLGSTRGREGTRASDHSQHPAAVAARAWHQSATRASRPSRSAGIFWSATRTTSSLRLLHSLELLGFKAATDAGATETPHMKGAAAAG